MAEAEEYEDKEGKEAEGDRDEETTLGTMVEVTCMGVGRAPS